MNRLSVRRRVGAGQLIPPLAHERPGVATVMSGVVKLVDALADGRQQIVALQFPGDLVGDPFASAGTLSAEAATPVEICQIGSAEFRAILDDYPEMQQLLARHAYAELAAARQWMLLLGRKAATERVASLFLLLAERQSAVGCDSQQDGPVSFTLPITRGDIADFLGLTIETVSRQIHILKDARALVFRGTRIVTVPDREMLRGWAELS
jgi:CRP/FNR family transcriptional regulator